MANDAPASALPDPAAERHLAMWFLILQILVLMLLAALLGAALAYWWLRRNYEDVTETHDHLMEEVRQRLASLGPVDGGQLDLAPTESRLGAIERALSGLRLPEPDLSPLNQRLDMLVSQVRTSDPGGAQRVETRIERIEQAITTLAGRIQQQQPPNLQPIEIRLARLEQSLAAVDKAVHDLQLPDVDLGPVHSGLALLEQAIESLDFPRTDLQPVHNHIGMIETRLKEIGAGLGASQKTHLDHMSAELSALASSMSAARAPSLEPLHERFGRLEAALSGIRIPAPDFAPLQERLGRIEAGLGAIRLPEPDLAPLHERLAQVEVHLRAPVQHLETLHSRLSNVERLLSTVSTRVAEIGPPDLQPVEQQVRALSGRIDSLPRTDLEPLVREVSGLSALVSGLRLPSLAPVEDQLARLEDAYRGLSQARPDLGPVERRLASLQEALMDLRLPDLGPVERRIEAVQDAVLRIREPDLSPILASVRTIDSRLDLGAVENRLTAVEYGLTAIHHALRHRGEGATTRTETSYGWISNGDGRREPPGPQYAEPVVRPWESERGTRTSAGRPGDLVRYRRPGDRANLLTEPAFGPRDDLQQINGIGPMLADLLNDIGVYYFWQVAEWDGESVAWVDSQLLHFRGRIERDDWVAQARTLAVMPNAARRPDA